MKKLIAKMDSYPDLFNFILSLIALIIGIGFFIFVTGCGGSGGGNGVSKLSVVHVPDADKKAGMSNLCWAAGGANALTFTEWSSDEDETLSIFSNRFGNVPGYPEDAMWWYLNHHADRSDYTSFTVFEEIETEFIEFISHEINIGSGVLIWIEGGALNLGHILTIYGIEKINDIEYNLIVVDSNDGVDRQFDMRFKWDGMDWICNEGLYFGSFIYAVDALRGEDYELSQDIEI